MPSLNRVQLDWTKATRGLVRVVAISAVLGTVACYDNPAATAPDRGRPIAAQAASAERQPAAGATILRGTIVTPSGVIKHGYVGIVSGRIVSVSNKEPDIANATTVNTEGIILPGFVDVHNHLP